MHVRLLEILVEFYVYVIFIPSGKTSSTILLKLVGMVTEARQPHHINADSAILVTLFGMITEIGMIHPRNAESPILVTLSGMVISLSLP